MFLPALVLPVKETPLTYLLEMTSSVCSGEGELIKIANDTEYGLGCVILSENVERAHKVGKKIECGMVHVNGPAMSQPSIPFGGAKGSGFGRQYAEYGLHEYSNIKTVTINEN